MKLQPRERKVRSDYLLENAAELGLGYLFLGWKRKVKKPKRKGKPAKSEEVSTTGRKNKKGDKASSSRPVKKIRRAGAPIHPTPTPPLPPSPSVGDKLDLNICFVNGETLKVQASSHWTVAELKAQIGKCCPSSDSNPALFANGGMLSPNGSLISHLGVTGGSVIYCMPGADLN